MRYRLLLLLSVVVACVSLSLTGAHLKFRYFTPAPPSHLPHSSAGYLGVFKPEAPPSYAPITNFARTIGEQPNLVGYYSGWAEQFPSSFAQKLHSHHQIPYVQIDPTYATVSQIADGTYDAYLQTYADSVREFGHAVVIGFGHEMNARWYTWGYGHVKAATFVAAWRHIVTLFRARGADNVTWLWTINADTHGSGRIADWWPGKAYVSWVGIDGYYTKPNDTFASVFGRTISQVRRITNEPILLSETAVSPNTIRIAKITDLFRGLAQYRMLGLVWFDMQSDTGIIKEDWQIEGNRPAENAFRYGASSLNLVKP